MYSIFDFWQNIVENKNLFLDIQSLTSFPYDYSIFSYAQNGKGFPNFSIKVNNNTSDITGGELIQLKNRNEYLIAPFKSAIPKGRTEIKEVFDANPTRNIRTKMELSGDDVFSLTERDVYYLIRGKKGDHQKICLVHGSFFETISDNELIRQSWAQVLDERFSSSDISFEDRKRLEMLFSEQGDFSKLQNVGTASVKLRLKITTEVKPEVKPEGNILNSKQYPEIADDTLNFVVPFHSSDEKEGILRKMGTVMSLENFKVFDLKHPLNGWFVIFQVVMVVVK